VMRAAGDHADGVRLRGLIIVLWRAGLRISEALAMTESDLDADRGAVLIRRGKDGKRREVGMDRWAWEQLAPWPTLRSTRPVGALFCILRGPTQGGTPISPSPRCICAASTTPRSCTPSTNDPHPRFLPTTGCCCAEPTLGLGRTLDPSHRRKASAGKRDLASTKGRVRAGP
jgi:hypothetical protein